MDTPMSSIVKAWSLAYGRSTIVALVAAAVVVLLGCPCIFVPLWGVTRADLSIRILIVSASLYVLILNGGVPGALGWGCHIRSSRHSSHGAVAGPALA